MGSNIKRLANEIRLVISDVDGTLLTSKKELTAEAVAAVQKLKAEKILFTLTSGRPPLGMKYLIDELRITVPFAAFNGGVYLKPDLTVIEERPLPAHLVEKLIDIILAAGLDLWVFTAKDWLVRGLDAPYVAHESQAVRFSPRVVSDFKKIDGSALKLVAVSSEPEKLKACQKKILTLFAGEISASQSQKYYLDITSLEANKGVVVETISRYLSILTSSVATLGDNLNDVPMFAKSGVSIAMGNASAEVKERAAYLTATNDENGFARAVEKYVLGQTP